MSNTNTATRVARAVLTTDEMNQVTINQRKLVAVNRCGSFPLIRFHIYVMLDVSIVD